MLLRYEPRSGSTATLDALHVRDSSKLAHDDIGESRDVSSIHDQFGGKFAFKACHGSNSDDTSFVSIPKSPIRIHAKCGGQQTNI